MAIRQKTGAYSPEKVKLNYRDEDRKALEEQDRIFERPRELGDFLNDQLAKRSGNRWQGGRPVAEWFCVRFWHRLYFSELATAPAAS
jgi:hypothetical protein